MKTITTITILTSLIFSSCGTRTAKVSNVNHSVPVENTSNEQNWRASEDAKFFGTMFVALF